MTTLCFVDTETTGLDPDQHEVWEVAVILRRLDDDGRSRVPDDEFVWQLPVDLGRADPIALNIGRFHDRRWPRGTGSQHEIKEMSSGTCVKVLDPTIMWLWAERFAELTWGAHMIGAVPSFDTDRLGRLLRRLDACPGWHYQPIDVETLAAGYMIGTCRGVCIAGDITRFGGLVQGNEIARSLPWSSDEIAQHHGVRVDEEARHTALGDARWARDLWDRIHQ